MLEETVDGGDWWGCWEADPRKIPKPPLLWKRPLGGEVWGHRWPSFLPVPFDISPTNNTSPEYIIGLLLPMSIFHEGRAMEGLYIHLDSREEGRLKGI